jgi:SAM-dependent methyltransferase
MAFLRKYFMSWSFFKALRLKINNQHCRDDFIIAELKKISAGKLLLDAGCGSQRYRKHCQHLRYRAQDFGQYTKDIKKMIGGQTANESENYNYGPIDYVGDIWSIDALSGTFDAILCTEVFEHIPYPIETLREFSRLLKKDGKLILTAPSNCLRHMDPYFFYSGFSDRWYEKFLNDNGFEIESISSVGDYYQWLAVELARTAKANSILAKLTLAPAFFYYFYKNRTDLSVSTLCMGYHVVAIKK